MAGDKEETLSGSITDTELTSMRNVAGELQAVLSVIEYAQQKGIKKAVICYDYEGIENGIQANGKQRKLSHSRTVTACTSQICKSNSKK